MSRATGVAWLIAAGLFLGAAVALMLERRQVRNRVEAALHPITGAALVSSMDLRHPPSLVQRQVKHAGVVGKPKVENFRAVFGGAMRISPEGHWMEIPSRQCNLFADAARVFSIHPALFGIHVDGVYANLGNSGITQPSVAWTIWTLVEIEDNSVAFREVVPRRHSQRWLRT